MLDMAKTAAQEFADFTAGQHFGTVLADPPWRFTNRTGKVAPEHKRLSRYPTLTLDEICGLPVAATLADTAHCYLWVPNALLPEGLRVLDAWASATSRTSSGTRSARMAAPTAVASASTSAT
jgi:N6-adenosine-specific RNA methylase IME4